MKRLAWMAATCLLGGLLAFGVVNQLERSAQAADAAAPLAESRDIVINEIAWGGTDASSWDEWIELYNNTLNTITLDGWSITFADGSPATITLNGNIAPHAFYLLERDDKAVGNIDADLEYGGAQMNNGGEQVTLYDATGHVVDTANIGDGEWPAGSGSPDYYTMERIDPTTSDTDDNWCANDPAVAQNGEDANGNPINGTPKAQNSCYQPPIGDVADLVIAKQGPHQIVPGHPITYRVALSNTGTITATAVRVTDTLPTAVISITTTPSASLKSGNLLVWEIRDVATGTHHLITVTGRVTETATGFLTNHVTATTTASETVTTNNSADWPTTIVIPGRANLHVRKTGPDVVIPGDPITYRIALSNTGEITATTVRVTDTLPAPVSFLGQTSPFTFSPVGNTLIWQAGDMTAGKRHLITVTGRVVGTAAYPMTLTNWVTATTTAAETTTADNSDTCETLIDYPGTAQVLITALHYYAYQGFDDEAVQVANLGTAPADLGGWYLSDDPTAGTGTSFPISATLAPGASLWCAKSATIFEEEFGFKPDYETDGTDPTVPELDGTWPGYANSGDECALLDAEARLVDLLVYGDGSAGNGWNGTALQPWTPSTAFAKTGQILYRKLDQATGLPTPDTNTAADWAQDPSDHIDGRKVQYPGWDLGAFFQTVKVTETANLTIAIAPDNAYEVIINAIAGAVESIQVEGYTFENGHLIDVLVDRAQASVTVRLLLEGEKVTDQERWLGQRLSQAGGELYFFHNDDSADVHDRYRFQHAKFIIIDDQTLIVGSENFNYSGLPADDKLNGTWGRRGAFFITDAPSVVARAQAIFSRDLDTAHKDIVRWEATHPRYGIPTPGFTPTYVYSDWVTYTVEFAQPFVLTDTLLAFEVVQSPENALRDTDGLLGLVKRAGTGDVVLVEQLYEREHWGPSDGSPVSDPNPRLEAYIDAAREGARVRVLLNSSWDAGSVLENLAARAYVNGIARREQLDLKAQVGDPTGRGIHNKMVLVWLEGEGGYVHVGSINGSEISNKGNRELALQVKSDAAYEYLAAVFTHDWWRSTPVFLPLAMRSYTTPEPPVEYVVISEVMYRPGGQSTGNREWVELYNPTDQAIDLSGWYLGDAAAGGEYGAGMYLFPEGTVLPAQGIVVVAQQAEDFEGVSGFAQPHFEFLIDPNRDDPAVPNMVPTGTWDGFGFGLGDGGDKVVLRDADETDVDAVVYGTATYPGVIPHPGGVEYNWSLERRPPYYDTDNCSVDFVPRYPSSPGSVPSP